MVNNVSCLQPLSCDWVVDLDVGKDLKRNGFQILKFEIH